MSAKTDDEKTGEKTNTEAVLAEAVLAARDAARRAEDRRQAALDGGVPVDGDGAPLAMGAGLVEATSAMLNPAFYPVEARPESMRPEASK